MRMDVNGNDITAATLVNGASQEELKNIISLYGEDPLAQRIAREIIKNRNCSPVKTTQELANIIEKAYPAEWKRKARNHPATRTFQALRIALNEEIDELRSFLAQILPDMALHGILCIISFHSIEDRIVKNAMRNWAKGCICPSHQLNCVCFHKPEVKIIYKKPLVPDNGELAVNPRAKSAKLRAMEKIWDIQE